MCLLVSECVSLCAVVSDACRDQTPYHTPISQITSLHVSLSQTAPLSLLHKIMIIIISFPFTVTITSTILLCNFRHLFCSTRFPSSPSSSTATTSPTTPTPLFLTFFSSLWLRVLSTTMSHNKVGGTS